jgi:cytidyltransferase-like protein
MRNERKKIGVLVGGYKPFHAGHMQLIELAASENDAVYVFVSLKDRSRPGEITVKGSTMKIVWKRYIEPILPDNVIVVYNEARAPVIDAFDLFTRHENERDVNVEFNIYSDHKDLQRTFNDKTLSFYDFLRKNNAFVLHPTDRLAGGMSATRVRHFIEDEDFESFDAAMPHSMDTNGVWELLRKDLTQQGERHGTLR